jgi:hypothetical protein
MTPTLPFRSMLPDFCMSALVLLFVEVVRRKFGETED